MSDSASFHFSAATLTFLSGLAAHNSRDWFEAHRSDYETGFKAPADVFCALMTHELEAMTGLAHATRTYRIHRDVRFSKDKTPYNAHLHLSFTPTAGPSARPAWFFGLEPGRLTVGAGLFGFEGADLIRYRERVAGPEGEDLEAALAQVRSAGFDPREPDLKRVPPPYAPDHPRGDLLRRKSLSCWMDFSSTDTATTPGVVPAALGAFRGARPLFDWLMDGFEAD